MKFGSEIFAGMRDNNLKPLFIGEVTLERSQSKFEKTKKLEFLLALCDSYYIDGPMLGLGILYEFAKTLR